MPRRRCAFPVRRSCGACCVADGDGGDALAYGYADLTPEDVARVSTRVRRQLFEFFIGGETRYATRAKQLTSGAIGCQHLRGTPGQRCSCSIYATRPKICQTFPAGSVLCRAARQSLTITRAETRS